MSWIDKAECPEPASQSVIIESPGEEQNYIDKKGKERTDDKIIIFLKRSHPASIIVVIEIKGRR